MRFILLGRLLTQCARLAQDFIRPLPGDAVGADGDIDLEPRIQMITQNFLDRALGAQGGRGVVGERYRDQLAMPRTTLGCWGYEDVILDTGIVREQKSNAALLHVTTHDLGMRPCQHLNHLTLSATAPVHSCHRHQDFITVEDLIHLAGREEEVITALKRPGKAIAVAVPHDAATQQVHSLGQSIGAPPAGDNLAVALHGTQSLA